MNGKIMPEKKRPLKIYLALAYVINLIVCSRYYVLNVPDDLAGKMYLAAVCVTYPLVYLMPVIILAVMLRGLAPLSPERRVPAGGVRTCAALCLEWAVVICCASLTILLLADVRLYELYGFHINAFVINLVLTPGGIDSLGSSTGAMLMAGAIAVGILGLHILAYLLIRSRLSRLMSAGRWLKFAVPLFACLMLGERLAYGLADIRQSKSVLKASRAVPLYNHVTFRSLAENLGINTLARDDIVLKMSDNSLIYPLNGLSVSQPAPQPNIIWLVSESMRRDQLTPEIMPNTWRESSHGWRFTNHLSGGNGTRQGLFALFYGLHGSYWDAFLREHRSPLLIDILQERGYALQMHTSASFTYPEFDQTLFSALPDSSLHEQDKGLPPWQRDVRNTDDILDFLANRNSDTPFMIFMFYESTHARYDFPESSVIRQPYLQDLNYATMTRASLASRDKELLNRYTNASHFIDEQQGRIYEALTEMGLWDETIVLMTGDHGEEFMENGFWGHNSGFSEQQIGTPMVLWLPDVPPAVSDRLTVHTDVIATLLPRLGITNPPEDYTLGEPMDQDNDRKYVVASDWAGLCYIDGGFKFSIPLRSDLAQTNELHTRQDQVVENVIPFLGSHRRQLQDVLASARKFSGP